MLAPIPPSRKESTLCEIGNMDIEDMDLQELDALVSLAKQKTVKAVLAHLKQDKSEVERLAGCIVEIQAKVGVLARRLAEKYKVEEDSLVAHYTGLVRRQFEEIGEFAPDVPKQVSENGK